MAAAAIALGGGIWLVRRVPQTEDSAGLIVAAFATRTLEGLLHGVERFDAVTSAVAAGGLLGLATLAAWRPAAEAEKVNPAETLRAE